MLIEQIKIIYTIKSNIISNQTLDPKGGDIIMSRIILPMSDFKTFVLMNSPLGKISYSKWRNNYEYPKKNLDRNAHIPHLHVVFGILFHSDYI